MNSLAPTTSLKNINDEFSSLNNLIQQHLKKSIYILVQLNRNTNQAFVYDLGGLMGSRLNKLTTLLGINPIKKHFIVSEKEIENFYHSKELLQYNGNLSNIAGKRFPAWLCNSIEKIYGLGDIYSIGIKQEEVIIGTLFVFPKNQEEKQFSILNAKIPEYAQRMKEILDRNKKSKDFNIRDRFTKAIIENISHEIRTPLNGIISILDAGLQLLENNETTQALTQSIWKSSNDLTNKIDNLLLIADLQSNATQFKMEAIPLVLLIRQINSVVKKLKKEFDSRIIFIDNKINYPTKAHIFIDKHFFKIALKEIISNALKFSENTIKIGLYTNNMLKICVSDEGIGLSDIENKYLFDLFYKPNQSNPKHKGLGIGLNIVKHIAEAHHWNLDISSIQNKGTKATISIPILMI